VLAFTAKSELDLPRRNSRKLNSLAAVAGGWRAFTLVPEEGRVATPLLVHRAVKEKLSAISRVPGPLRFSGSLLTTLALALGAWLSRAEQSVSLAWDANTETNIVGYRLYYGPTSQSLTNTADAGPQLTVTVTGLREGTTYYFAVTARNLDGLESDFSDQVSYTVPSLSLLLNSPANLQDPMRLRFDAGPGHAYEILATEDFETWTTLYYTTPSANGWVEYADVESPTLPKRFYRLIRH
jgi:hypothetical protein